jgi:hypothetical protein
MLLGRVLMPKVLGLPRPQLFISVRSLLSVVCVRQENSEELFIVSARHRSWCVFDRVACLPERGENHFCNACLPEIRRASPAVFHGLGRKRSHLASAEMVRAGLERSRAAMRAYSAIFEAGRLSGFYGNLECLKNISDIQYQTG